MWYLDRATLYVLWQCSMMQCWKEQLFFIRRFWAALPLKSCAEALGSKPKSLAPLPAQAEGRPSSKDSGRHRDWRKLPGRSTLGPWSCPILGPSRAHLPAAARLMSLEQWRGCDVIWCVFTFLDVIMKFKAMLLSPSRPVSFQLMRSPSNAFSFQRTLLPARSPSSAFSFQSILLSTRSPCNEFSFQCFLPFICVLLPIPMRSPSSAFAAMPCPFNAFFFQRGLLPIPLFSPSKAFPFRGVVLQSKGFLPQRPSLTKAFSLKCYSSGIFQSNIQD